MSDEAITNETPEWILIKDIFRAKELQVRDGTSASMASRYANSLDKLPPVTLYNVKSIPSSKEGEGSRDGGPDGSVLLLVDGWHRVLAFEMGDDDGPRDEIQAIVHQGTWGDAREAAAMANLANAKALSVTERARAIGIVLEENPRATQEVLADKVGVSQSYISKIKRASVLRKETGFGSDKVGDGIMTEVLLLKKKDWQPVVLSAAVKNDWSQPTVRKVVKTINLHTTAHDSSPDVWLSWLRSTDKEREIGKVEEPLMGNDPNVDQETKGSPIWRILENGEIPSHVSVDKIEFEGDPKPPKDGIVDLGEPEPEPEPEQSQAQEAEPESPAAASSPIQEDPQAFFNRLLSVLEEKMTPGEAGERVSEETLDRLYQWFGEALSGLGD